MGTLARFTFSPEFVAQFPVFVETGTGFGASLAYAAGFGFKRLWSVDSEAALAERAAQMFCDDARVSCLCGDSVAALEEILAGIPPEVGVVFWLDAHFPGADVLGQPHDAEPDNDRRLPLEAELRAIRRLHPNAVVLVDDLRIYIDGPFAHGNLPAGYTGLGSLARRRAAQAIFQALGETHDCQTFYDEEGYAVLAPIGQPSPERVEFGAREYCGIARRSVEVGDWFGVSAAYRRVLEATDPPDTGLKRIARGEACRFFAAEAHEKSNDGTACDWFYRALAADPLCIDYRIDFVTQALLPIQWLDIARQEAARACRIEPLNPRCWQTAAVVEREAGDAAAMSRFVQKALEVGPDDGGSALIAAIYYADTAQFEEAKRQYLRAMSLAPHRHAEALHGYGIVLDREGRTEEAVRHLDAAIELGIGDQTLARWNRSEMLLTLGRYEEGWRDHALRFDDKYRGRELAAFGRLGRRFKAPLFRPDMDPCRVHVHGEMGYGDVLCMARYLPLLEAMGHDVRLEVAPELVGLLQFSFPAVKVVERAVDYPGALGLAEFDCHITTMSFPSVFGTTLDTVPWSGPYLQADPAMTAEAGRRFGNCGRKRVGLCWTAGIRPGIWYTEYGRRKSIDFERLDPFFKCDAERVTFQLFDFEKQKMTFAETAAILANLDLLITVDTAIAHLAGAMGLPVWLMMHAQGSWHWMRERLDSPWYSSVRLFRAQRPHDWAAVVDAVAGELRLLLG